MPAEPDHSQGYVWALYDTYDIFRAKADGSDVTRLTDTPGYDAEGTVARRTARSSSRRCATATSISTAWTPTARTSSASPAPPGYDGGAFFNADCTKIVWRASRPKPGKELDDYKKLLRKGLVRPTKLELYVANADGSEAAQITYLDAASFAPFWHPSQKRILFSSNYGDPKGREFDIWAVDIDGTNLERITYAPGFDGFPMFSPDGKYLAFSSNRATAPGKHDTNVFVARWVDTPPRSAPMDNARRSHHGRHPWLADPAREGRGVGTAGPRASGEYIEERYKELGLAPARRRDGFRQTFPVTTGVKVDEGTSLKLGKRRGATRCDRRPVGYLGAGRSRRRISSSPATASARRISESTTTPSSTSKGRSCVVRRFVPEGGKFDRGRRAAPLRRHSPQGVDCARKGSEGAHRGRRPGAAERRARRTGRRRTRRRCPARAEGLRRRGLPVLVVKRAAASRRARAARQEEGRCAPSSRLRSRATKQEAFNVVARLTAGAPESQRLPGVVVLGAHYDHLGMGGRDSLAPDKHEPHLGADDNASGTAALLEAARALASRKSELRRDVVFIVVLG